MDKKIKAEIKGLIKAGFPEDIAIITACANAGKPEHALEYLEELNDDQQDIMQAIELMGMRPFHEVVANEIVGGTIATCTSITTDEAIKITHHELEPINEIIFITSPHCGDASGNLQ
jgi:hypothetical protein